MDNISIKRIFPIINKKHDKIYDKHIIINEKTHQSFKSFIQNTSKNISIQKHQIIMIISHKVMKTHHFFIQNTSKNIYNT